MPPKSNTKTNKKPSTKLRSVANKILKKNREQTPNIRPKSIDTISLGSASDDFNIKRISERGGSLKHIDSEVEKSGPKLVLETREDAFKKLLDELAPDGSSTESETQEDEPYYYQPHQKSFIADASLLKVGTVAIPESDEGEEEEEEAEEEAAVDDESSEEDMPEYLKQKPLVEEPDYLGRIGSVPDVEQISADVSVEKIKIKKKGKRKQKHAGHGDAGIFVDPLTGKRIMMPESDEEEVIVVVKREKRLTAESVTYDGRYVREVKLMPPASDDEVSIDLPSDHEIEEEAAKVTVAADDTFDQFLELEDTGPRITFDEIDEDAIRRAEKARVLRRQTYEFVQHLIDMAVKKAEYVDPSVILRQNLDKRKLIEELHANLHMREAERKGKQFLNRKCVEYFRRKRIYRPILPDNPKTMHIEYRKCQEAMAILDKWLLREEEAKIATYKTLEVAQKQFHIENARSQNKVKELEELISKTLKRENFDKLQQVVTRALHQMDVKRKELSEVRYHMIQKQHEMAVLLERLRCLEDLGNGLTIREFGTVQTDTQVLSKKVEERSAELFKLRLRGQTDIHRMAHMKEKQQMLQDNLDKQRSNMDQLQIEKQNLREFLTQVKSVRNRLRAEIKEISYQSGLFDQPLLMDDYDATVEHLADLKTRVGALQLTMSTLNAKIKILEQKCNKK